jgi:hypothetical protein
VPTLGKREVLPEAITGFAFRGSKELIPVMNIVRVDFA